MGFWGIEVKPGKPYPYHSDNVPGKLHITQATLGLGTSTERSILQCSVGHKNPIFLCSLMPNKIESCPLDLEFDDEDLVAFSIIGPRSIHLSGFFVPNEEDVIKDDYESDSFGEDIVETDSESSDYDMEDEYDDDFINDDDDLDMYPPSPIPNSGVVIEEIVDDVAPKNGDDLSKHLKKDQSSGDENKNSSQKQIVAKRNARKTVLDSEDEDGFPISSKDNGKINNQKNEAEPLVEQKDERMVANVKKRKANDSQEKVDNNDKDDTLDRQKKKKKKKQKKQDKDGKSHEAGDDNDSGEQPMEVKNDNNLDPDSPATKEHHKELSNDRQKKKKQEKQDKDGKSHEAGDDNDSGEQPMEVKNDNNLDPDSPATKEHHKELSNDRDLGITMDHDNGESLSGEKKKKKKKKKKGKEIEGGAAVDESTEQKGSTLSVENEKEAKSSQVRTFANGLVIEEISMGKPDGKRASRGNQVSVHYIGKLKKNGKIFDSNIGRAPFKFRLGVGSVIKGWDVGVEVMRVGDKRRLTIPPSMGYGEKGAGGKIPGNSWLVFDVELVAVR